MSCHVPTSNPIPTQSHPPVLNVVCPSVNTHFCPSPGNPVPMDVDAAWKKASLLITCYHCRRAGHNALDCDLHFDICTCTVNELQGFLEDRLAALDILMEEDKPKVQDFAIHSK